VSEKLARQDQKKFFTANALNGYISKTRKYTKRWYAMSLATNAIITDTEEVWNYLQANVDERNKFEPDMEGWINGMSNMLEYETNRKIVSRTYTNVTQNGNGRMRLNLDFYPIISITALAFRDSTGTTVTTVTPATEVVINHAAGQIEVVPSVGPFIKGFQNIVLTYTAGFAGTDLEPFKNAVKEMIAVLWFSRGDNPLVFVGSDNIGTSVSNTKFDPRRLAPIIQRVVWMLRNVEV
jgi:hypothetical protein